MYLVQASPLTKIFLEEYREQAMDLLYSESEEGREQFMKFVTSGDPFSITIPRPSGAVTLVHGRPVHAATLIPHVKERKIEEDEVSPLFAWLTDEGNHETAMYGVVSVEIQQDISMALMAIVNESRGDKEAGDFVSDVKKQLTDSINDARVRADARVMKHCKQMYNTVKETYDIMTKEGKGVYSPSYSEALSMEILKDEISRTTRHTKVSQEKFKETMTKLTNTAGM